MSKKTSLSTNNFIFITNLIKFGIVIYIMFYYIIKGATFTWGGGFVFLIIQLLSVIWLPFVVFAILQIVQHLKMRKLLKEKDNAYRKAGVIASVMALLCDIIFYVCGTLLLTVLCFGGHTDRYFALIFVFLFGFVEIGFAIVSIAKLTKKEKQKVEYYTTL